MLAVPSVLSWLACTSCSYTYSLSFTLRVFIADGCDVEDTCPCFHVGSQHAARTHAHLRLEISLPPPRLSPVIDASSLSPSFIHMCRIMGDFGEKEITTRWCVASGTSLRPSIYSVLYTVEQAGRKEGRKEFWLMLC